MSDFAESAWADDTFAGNYLDKADVYIPHRRKMFRFVSSLFAYCFDGHANIRLLDLGCGDGILSEALLMKSGFSSATLIDGNEGMLQRAQIRLKAFRNVHFVKATFQDILSGVVDLGDFDLCVSSMAIHHLDLDEKAALFRCISSRLHPGGHFVNIDMVLPPSRHLEGWYFAMWKDWIGWMMTRWNIEDESPEDLIKRYKDPMSMNKPDTLGDQLKALKAAGLEDVDCYYKNGVFAIFGGKKRQEQGQQTT